MIGWKTRTRTFWANEASTAGQDVSGEGETGTTGFFYVDRFPLLAANLCLPFFFAICRYLSLFAIIFYMHGQSLGTFQFPQTQVHFHA